MMMIIVIFLVFVMIGSDDDANNFFWCLRLPANTLLAYNIFQFFHPLPPKKIMVRP